jgi:hypothetical protein
MYTHTVCAHCTATAAQRWRVLRLSFLQMVACVAKEGWRAQRYLHSLLVGRIFALRDNK